MDCIKCGKILSYDNTSKSSFKMKMCMYCEAKKPADLPEAGASAERISSVVRSNADEIENLKCCGNCLHRSTIDMGSYSDETCDKDNNLSSWQYCQKWEFDGIERSGRTEGFDVK